METTHKTCSKCKEKKEISFFCKNKRNKDGLNGVCRDCKHKEKVRWRKENPEKLKEEKKRYRLKNPEKFREMSRNYMKNNLDKISERIKNKYLNNPELIEIDKIKAKNYRIFNKQRLSELRVKYLIHNKERLNANNRVRSKKYRETLKNSYVKSTLTSRGFNLSQISKEAIKELIEVQTIILKTKRLCKTSPNYEQV